MPTTAINALRYPAGADAPNGPTAVQNLASDADTRMVARFATTAARDSAITSPVNGMVVWCDSPGCYFDRIGGAWVARPQLSVGTTTLSGSTVPSTARIVHLRISTTTTISNTLGGFTANFGMTFSGLIAVAITAGDNASGQMGAVTPAASSHTMSTAAGTVFTPSGGFLAQGTLIRVELDVVGYM